MPVPKPRKREEQDKFMSRCMGDSKMNEEFPDQKQRVAVCMQSWREMRGGKKPKSDK